MYAVPLTVCISVNIIISLRPFVCSVVIKPHKAVRISQHYVVLPPRPSGQLSHTHTLIPRKASPVPTPATEI